jgi:hypothetical protein
LRSTPPYFSINGGVTNLDDFNNCNNGGDYGDWITHTPSQVQDAFTNFSAAPFLTYPLPETRALDVIGYDVNAVAGPNISINDVTVSEGTSGTTNATFVVTLSASSAQTTSVNYQTADGTASGTANIAPNGAPITIPTAVAGTATPYPSTITVPAGIGNLTKVTSQDQPVQPHLHSGRRHPVSRPSGPNRGPHVRCGSPGAHQQAT